MKKASSIGWILIGIALMLAGGWKVYTALNPKVETPEPVKVGETVTDEDGVNFCVTAVENTQSVGEGYTAVTTENNFVVLSNLKQIFRLSFHILANGDKS